MLPTGRGHDTGACSSASNRGVTGNVGIGTGVALSTPGSVTQIQQCHDIVVTASVTADVNNAGVDLEPVWRRGRPGRHAERPDADHRHLHRAALVLGAADATITATSVVNSATAAAVTLIVLGTPQMNPVQLFPGNVNVPYGPESRWRAAWRISPGRQPTRAHCRPVSF